MYAIERNSLVIWVIVLCVQYVLHTALAHCIMRFNVYFIIIFTIGGWPALIGICLCLPYLVTFTCRQIYSQNQLQQTKNTTNTDTT